MKLRISLIFCKLNVTGKWRDNNDNDDDDCLIVWPFGDSTLVGVITITILTAICIVARREVLAEISDQCMAAFPLIRRFVSLACLPSIKGAPISPSLYTLCYMLISE